MKRLLLIGLLLIVGCSKEPINYEETLNERDGVFYTKDTNKPYSGQVFSLYDDGKKKGEGTIKDGKMISKTEWEWYENGQKEGEETYKNGKLDGRWTKWYMNGQKEEEGSYKDGEKDGKWTEWSGGEGDTRASDTRQPYHKIFEGTYKDGRQDGLWTSWNEYGQKDTELTFKDGKLDGLTKWYENGQKALEKTYKNGVFISEKCWDEDGNNENCLFIVAGGGPVLIAVSLAQAKNLFDDGVIFVDARADEYFAEGHIQNAWNSGFFMELMWKLDSLQTKDGPVVIYCGDDECGSSEELAYDLSDEGFTKLFTLWGGLEAWNEAGYPTENQ